MPHFSLKSSDIMRSGPAAWRAKLQQDSRKESASHEVYVFVVDGPAPGKPRMTQRDKWKKRPCVVAYRAWCDRVRYAAGIVPLASAVSLVSVTAFYAPPPSWSKSKRAASIGQMKRSKPDGDNILKALTDALWSSDEMLGDQRVQRRWGECDPVVVRSAITRLGAPVAHPEPAGEAGAGRRPAKPAGK
jgi:Holliday junction resolvase RusA-like endonuclease